MENPKIGHTNVNWATVTNSPSFGQLDEWQVMSDNRDIETNPWATGIQPLEGKKINLGEAKILATRQDFKEIFGYECRKELSLGANIFEAIEAKNFPTVDVCLKNITFDMPADGERVLPNNFHVENGRLPQGILSFYSGKVSATAQNAIPVACGPNAIAVNLYQGDAIAINGANSYSNGRAHAYDGGKAHSSAEGIAYAWTHDTEGHADGVDARAYGFALDATLYVTNGAKAHSDINGIKVYVDGKLNKALPTVLQIKTVLQTKEEPTPSTTIFSPFNTILFSMYFDRLKQMADAGVADAAFKVGMLSNNVLRDFCKEDNPRVFYLTLAYNLGRTDAMLQLGKYYMQRDNFVYSTDNLWQALNCYSIAQAEMKEVPADLQQEMDFIKSRLNISDEPQPSPTPTPTILPGSETPTTNTNG